MKKILQRIQSLWSQKRMNNSGKIIFFSGPSGVGKGTIINALRDKHPEWVFPPSCTTRKPRPGEIDGETYYFISGTEFRKKSAADDFLEFAEVHGKTLYGTLKEKLLKPKNEGKIVIREFDVQGFSQARKMLNRKDFVGIFVNVEGGKKELSQRIVERAPIKNEELAERMMSYDKEVSKIELYDHVIFSVHGKIDQMIHQAETIILDSIK